LRSQTLVVKATTRRTYSPSRGTSNYIGEEMAEKEFGDNVQGTECKKEEQHLLVIDCPD